MQKRKPTFVVAQSAHIKFCCMHTTTTAGELVRTITFLISWVFSFSHDSQISYGVTSGFPSSEVNKV